MSDLSATIEAFKTGTYTVSRSASGSYGASGRYTEGSPSSFSIVASVQPLGGRDLQRLPEGMQTKELLSIYTSTELKTESSGHTPDIVTINGEQYQVQEVERWVELGNYYRATVAKVAR